MKENYERWMNREIQRSRRVGKSPPAAAQLLRAVQLVLPRVSVAVFSYHRGLLQPQYLSGRRVSYAGAGAAAADSGNGSRRVLPPRKYEPERFFALAKGHEAEPEGGERCFKCYRLRLEETAKAAKAGGFSYFTNHPLHSVPTKRAGLK